MYWLLPYEEQEAVRKQVIRLAEDLNGAWTREQSDQVFVFNGRKDRRIARAIIRDLTELDGRVADPFGGSGTFAYAALDEGRRILWNEWEPYAHLMATQGFGVLPSLEEIGAALEDVDQVVGHDFDYLYWTRCPDCGEDHVFDRLYYDRQPLEYFHPRSHERLGADGKNIAFRRGYACRCGATEKFFDDEDLQHLEAVGAMDDSGFPNPQLIENSRINLTAPEFTHYANLFPKRSRIALLTLLRGIESVENEPARSFLWRAAVAIAANAKYVDYRSKTQDLHCPPDRLVEVNVYHAWLAKVNRWCHYYLDDRASVRVDLVETSCDDFRRFLATVRPESVSLVLTDPPYGDSEPYFEKAQRFHPLMGYSLMEDRDRLSNEVVITDAPSRRELKTRGAFLQDIRQLFRSCQRALAPLGYMVMYFRPEQSAWLSDLNRLKLFARSAGFEPLMTIDVSLGDPSMRVLASAAWSFSSDVCFVFLRLPEELRRWYVGDQDIDELVYLAATAAAGDRAEPFTIDAFHTALRILFRAHDLISLTGEEHQPRIRALLARFAQRDGATYRLTGESPYASMNRGENAELRAREFAPVVVEELAAAHGEFTFEQFVIALSTYLDNGSREVIAQLNDSRRLVPELLLSHAVPTDDGTAFALAPRRTLPVPSGRIDLLALSPTEFERFVADYFGRRGFRNIQLLGGSGDRGVDILATSPEGELHLIQCKRYRPENRIGSTPIQRVDSYRRTRHAHHAWVVTTSSFTPQGVSEGRITGVALVDGAALQESLEILYPGVYYIAPTPAGQ